MNSEPPQQLYQYRILQRGMLPLSPEGAMDLSKEHRCTALAIWPAGERPLPNRTIFTDPSFTSAGKKEAQEHAARIGLTIEMMRMIFVTHRHRDHLPSELERSTAHIFQKHVPVAFSDMQVELCPGHAPDLHALIFQTAQHKSVWVVGDAVLNREWLLAWGYFWPNKYGRDEIVETWRSIAKILAHADIVIPGHGDEIQLTPELLNHLLTTFPNAPYAAMLPEVATTLRERLQRLKYV